MNTNSNVSQTRLYAPSGLSFDSHGNLWVIDDGNNRILEFPPANQVTGGAASVVLSQPNFTSTTVGLFATNWPTSIAFDSNNDLWVADSGFNRILEFTPENQVINGTPSLVLGQPNFTTSDSGLTQNTFDGPTGLAFDSHGNLWVSDTQNNRVLEFDPANQVLNGSASLVIGQPNFTSLNFGPSSNSTYWPFGLAFDSHGNLWIADQFGNRLLEFDPANQVLNGSASLVIGQPNFTTAYANTNQTSLNFPTGIAIDPAGNLWVTDSDNNRVLEFTTDNIVMNGTASIVLGHSNFTSNRANEHSYASAIDLNTPFSSTFDSHGNLWVADYGNNRILKFQPPFYTEEPASVVLGQPNFMNTNSNVSQTRLYAPSGLSFDSHGNLWVVDDGNNRILEFPPANQVTGGAASVVLGQPNFTLAGVDPFATFWPTSIAFDSNNDLWVADSGYNRVLEFDPANQVMNGTPLAVLGQPNFTSINQGFPVSQSNLSMPTGLAFDPHGNLWIVDTGYSRVLEFPPANQVTNGSASQVLGQPNFTTYGWQNTNQTSIGWPFGISFDPSGNLWLAAQGQNRVLEFDPANQVTNGSASLVIGQPNFTSANPGANQTSLNYVTSITFDTHGNLWVADSDNNRMLEFANVSAPPTNTSTTTIPSGGGGSGGGYCPNYPVCNYPSGTPSASSSTTISTSSTTITSEVNHVSLNASYNITGNVPTVVNVPGAGATIILTSSEQVPANLIVVNVTGSSTPPQSYLPIIVLNVSTVSSGNVSTRITLKYPCSVASNTIYPYKLNGANWNPINPFTVDAASCTVTFDIPKDPVVGLFEYQPPRTSVTTTISTALSTIVSTTIPKSPIQPNANNELVIIAIVVIVIVIICLFVLTRKRRGR